MPAPRVAVVTSSKDPVLGLYAHRLADAFESDEIGPEAGASEPAPLVLPADPASEAEVLVALDPVALSAPDAARHAFRVALSPTLGAWHGALDRADLVLLAHEAQRALAVVRGADPNRIRVVGPFGTTSGDDTLREDLGLAAETRILLIEGTELAATELQTVLIHLSLVRPPFLVLVDVGDDAELARALRSCVPKTGVRVALFSEPTRLSEALRAATLVMTNLDSVVSQLALAHGVPIAVLRPQARDREPLAHLQSAHLARGIASLPELASEIELALSSELSRQRTRALDGAGTAKRIRDAVFEGWETLRSTPKGLPLGFELLPTEAAAPRIEALAIRETQRKTREEAAIDRELAELKSRLEP